MTKIEERVGTLTTRLGDLLKQTKTDGIKFTRSLADSICGKPVSQTSRYQEIARRAGQLLHTKMTPDETNLSKLLLGNIAEGFLDDPRKVIELSKTIADTPNRLNFSKNNMFAETISLGSIDSYEYGIKVDRREWKDSTGTHHPLSFSIFVATLSKDPWELVFNSRDHFKTTGVKKAEQAIAKRIQEQGF